MAPLLAAAIVSGGISLTKAVVGAFQKNRANKKIKNLLANPVKYKRPEEYAQELTLRKQQAEQTRLPGQGYMEQNIGQSVSQALSASEKGAISSNVYQSSVGNILNKELDAYNNLGIQAAQFQQGNKEAYMGTLQRGAGYSDAEYQENVLTPYERKLNMSFSDRQAGSANLWGGLEGAASAFSDYAGTKYYGGGKNTFADKSKA